MIHAKQPTAQQLTQKLLKTSLADFFGDADAAKLADDITFSQLPEDSLLDFFMSHDEVSTHGMGIDKNYTVKDYLVYIAKRNLLLDVSGIENIVNLAQAATVKPSKKTLQGAYIALAAALHKLAEEGTLPQADTIREGQIALTGLRNDFSASKTEHDSRAKDPVKLEKATVSSVAMQLITNFIIFHKPLPEKTPAELIKTITEAYDPKLQKNEAAQAAAKNAFAAWIETQPGLVSGEEFAEKHGTLSEFAMHHEFQERILSKLLKELSPIAQAVKKAQANNTGIPG
ncbi:MAG: hypothetical protein EBR02_09715 [Alphaproteobacteria bacterium]|nr:hypothetical protein [Alphaproteobacteria bacterium]